MEKVVRIEESRTVQDVLGSANGNARAVEQALAVEIEPCVEGICIAGESAVNVAKAGEIVEKLLKLSKEGVPMTSQLSRYLAEIAAEGNTVDFQGYHPGWICMNAKGKPVLSKTQGQSLYVDALRKHEVTFAIGPAGTGKTYLAVAMAVQAFRRQEVERIILTRPAVEAGERLGFLPGDLQTKVDPYMRPLYDALQDLMGVEQYLKNMEKGLIEVSPLAYMRGRTLDNAYIILDEAQNTTAEQMKMFLTRVGFDSRVVITGDVTQVDLPFGQVSGLIEASRILRGVEGIAFAELSARDVVRNPIVQRIIKAYEKAGEHSRSGAERGRRNGRKDSRDKRH